MNRNTGYSTGAQGGGRDQVSISGNSGWGANTRYNAGAQGGGREMSNSVGLGANIGYSNNGAQGGGRDQVGNSDSSGWGAKSDYNSSAHGGGRDQVRNSGLGANIGYSNNGAQGGGRDHMSNSGRGTNIERDNGLSYYAQFSRPTQVQASRNRHGGNDSGFSARAQSANIRVADPATGVQNRGTVQDEGMLQLDTDKTPTKANPFAQLALYRDMNKTPTQATCFPQTHEHNTTGGSDTRTEANTDLKLLISTQKKLFMMAERMPDDRKRQFQEAAHKLLCDFVAGTNATPGEKTPSGNDKPGSDDATIRGTATQETARRSDGFLPLADVALALQSADTDPSFKRVPTHQFQVAPELRQAFKKASDNNSKPVQNTAKAASDSSEAAWALGNAAWAGGEDIWKHDTKATKLNGAIEARAQVAFTSTRIANEHGRGAEAAPYHGQALLDHVSAASDHNRAVAEGNELIARHELAAAQHKEAGDAHRKAMGLHQRAVLAGRYRVTRLDEEALRHTEHVLDHSKTAALAQEIVTGLSAVNNSRQAMQTPVHSAHVESILATAPGTLSSNITRAPSVRSNRSGLSFTVRTPAVGQNTITALGQLTTPAVGQHAITALGQRTATAPRSGITTRSSTVRPAQTPDQIEQAFATRAQAAGIRIRSPEDKNEE